MHATRRSTSPPAFWPDAGATGRRDAVEGRLVPDRSHGGSPPEVDLDVLRADHTLVDQLDGDDLQHDDHGGDHVDQLAAHEDDSGYPTESGHGVWVCRPVAMLAAVAADLTPAERAQLQAKARNAGDRLPQTVLSDMAEAGA